MEVFFYKLPLCPRCIVAERHLLKALEGKKYKLNIVNDLISLKKAGVYLVPAIAVNNNLLSGFFLNEKKIVDFIRDNSEALKDEG